MQTISQRRALARYVEQQKSDAAWTQALAAQLALLFQRARLQQRRAGK